MGCKFEVGMVGTWWTNSYLPNDQGLRAKVVAVSEDGHVVDVLFNGGAVGKNGEVLSNRLIVVEDPRFGEKVVFRKDYATFVFRADKATGIEPVPETFIDYDEYYRTLNRKAGSEKAKATRARRTLIASAFDFITERNFIDVLRAVYAKCGRTDEEFLASLSSKLDNGEIDLNKRWLSRGHREFEVYVKTGGTPHGVTVGEKKVYVNGLTLSLDSFAEAIGVTSE